MTRRQGRRLTHGLIAVWTATILVFLYLPIICVGLASFSKARYFRFPILRYDTTWYEKDFS